MTLREMRGSLLSELLSAHIALAFDTRATAERVAGIAARKSGKGDMAMPVRPDDRNKWIDLISNSVASYSLSSWDVGLMAYANGLMCIAHVSLPQSELRASSTRKSIFEKLFAVAKEELASPSTLISPTYATGILLIVEALCVMFYRTDHYAMNNALGEGALLLTEKLFKLAQQAVKAYPLHTQQLLFVEGMLKHASGCSSRASDCWLKCVRMKSLPSCPFVLRSAVLLLAQGEFSLPADALTALSCLLSSSPAYRECLQAAKNRLINAQIKSPESISFFKSSDAKEE